MKKGFKRSFDRLLSEGKGKQLLWLLIVSAGVVFLALVVARFLFKSLPWKQVVAVFLDPGCFGNENYEAEGLLLPLAIFSLVILSGLLVSTFTNVVENISDSVRSGHRRYKLNGHVLNRCLPLCTRINATLWL